MCKADLALSKQMTTNDLAFAPACLLASLLPTYTHHHFIAEDGCYRLANTPPSCIKYCNNSIAHSQGRSAPPSSPSTPTQRTFAWQNHPRLVVLLRTVATALQALSAIDWQKSRFVVCTTSPGVSETSCPAPAERIPPTLTAVVIDALASDGLNENACAGDESAFGRRYVAYQRISHL